MTSIPSLIDICVQARLRMTGARAGPCHPNTPTRQQAQPKQSPFPAPVQVASQHRHYTVQRRYLEVRTEGTHHALEQPLFTRRCCRCALKPSKHTPPSPPTMRRPKQGVDVRLIAPTSQRLPDHAANRLLALLLAQRGPNALRPAHLELFRCGGLVQGRAPAQSR